MQNIIDLANKLGEEIKKSEEFTAYEKAKELHDNDQGLQKLINEFNLKRYALIQENGKEEKDADLQEQLQKDMRSLYSEIMANELMKNFVDSKNKLDAIVNEVYDTLNYHITGQQPGCGSDCSSCSGCH